MSHLIAIIIIGLLAALGARSVFVGSRLFGRKGFLPLSTAGSLLGGVIAGLSHPARQATVFVAEADVWWSTLGAVSFIAAAAIARRAQLGRIAARVAQRRTE